MTAPQPFERHYHFQEGFFPSQNPINGLEGTCIDGLNAWLHGDVFRSDRGATAGPATMGAHPLMLVGDTSEFPDSPYGGMDGGLGTVTSHVGLIWFAGIGNACINNVVLGASGGSLYVIVNEQVYPVGLIEPTDAPVFTPSAEPSSKFTGGSWSVALAKFRQVTGAVSNRTPPSETIAVTNLKGHLALPTPPTDGTTHWLVYGSRRNFGGIGPWFRVTSIDPIGINDGEVDIDWLDGELGDLAPLLNDPPPQSDVTHCAALGAVMVAITRFGMCHPSTVGQPESYDPGLAIKVPSGEAPTGVTSRGTDGVVFIATANSLNALVLSGATDIPVLPRGIWESTGFAHGNAFCLAHNEIYGYSGMPVRTQGSEAPDTSFAIPVERYMTDSGFTRENTFVVFDERNHAVLFCSGNRALPYMMREGRWSVPISLPGTVQACVARNGQANLAINSTLYTLDTAGAGGSWFLQSPYQGPAGRMWTLQGYRASAQNNLTHDILKDLGQTSVGGRFPLAHTAKHGSPPVTKFQRFVRSAAVRISGSTGNQSYHDSTISGVVEPAEH